MMEVLRHAVRLLETPLLHVQDVAISPMLLLQTLTILGGSLLISRLFIRFLRRNLYNRAYISLGVQESISRVLHYIILTLGGAVALNHLGIDLTALAALGAVLMVGIGFGLQNIANNFISGLILLFERPIQVGDFVEVKGVLGTVRAINARSTTVETQDNVSIIVPNSHFVSESVTNWSHHDTRTRIHVHIHTAFGTDTAAVRDILLEVASAHGEVLRQPEPQVQFYNVGAFAYKFDLLVWIDDPRRQFFVRSDLHHAIVGAFKEHGIKIPYPQRDLHMLPTERP